MRRSMLATTLGLLTLAASAGAATLPARHGASVGQQTTAVRSHDGSSTKTKKHKSKTPTTKDPAGTTTSPATPPKPHGKP